MSDEEMIYTDSVVNTAYAAIISTSCKNALVYTSVVVI